MCIYTCESWRQRRDKNVSLLISLFSTLFAARQRQTRLSIIVMDIWQPTCAVQCRWTPAARSQSSCHIIEFALWKARQLLWILIKHGDTRLSPPPLPPLLLLAAAACWFFSSFTACTYFVAKNVVGFVTFAVNKLYISTAKPLGYCHSGLVTVAILLLFLWPSLVKIPRAKNIKLKSKVGMDRGHVEVSSAETKLSCIKTELKRCIMTESTLYTGWSKKPDTKIYLGITSVIQHRF